MANETDRTLQITDSYWALRKLIVHDQSVQEQLTQPLLELLAKPRQKPPAHVYEVDYYKFDHQSLVAELLVAGDKRPDGTSEIIRSKLADLYATAARLPKRPQEPDTPNIDLKPDSHSYTPILTDGYEFPLPPEFRRQRAPDGNSVDSVLTAAAAAWAIQQLEVAADLKQADKQ
jgi:hypothetical protein